MKQYLCYAVIAMIVAAYFTLAQMGCAPDKPVVEERIVCINCTNEIDASDVRADYLKVKVDVILEQLQSYFNNEVKLNSKEVE